MSEGKLVSALELARKRGEEEVCLFRSKSGLVTAEKAVKFANSLSTGEPIECHPWKGKFVVTQITEERGAPYAVYGIRVSGGPSKRRKYHREYWNSVRSERLGHVKRNRKG